MKLVFKYSLDEQLETMMGCIRYEKFWQAHEDMIKQSFLKHTTLEFQQDEITVIAHQDHSWSGDDTKPMRLACWLDEEWLLGAELMHELGHRLLNGNGVEEFDDTAEGMYLDHRRLFLFLYDAWVDVVGQAAADKKVARERKEDGLNRAWDFALSKSYSERQALIKNLIDE